MKNYNKKFAFEIFGLKLIENLKKGMLSKFSDTKSNNSLSTLNIFLANSSLTLLNYSLIDSSLNIKLKCTSKESKEILEKAKRKAQMDCHDLLRKSRNDDMNNLTCNDKIDKET